MKLQFPSAGLSHRLVQFFIFTTFLLPALANAQLFTPEQVKSNWGYALGGAITTVAIHELGHFIAAEIEGTEAKFDGITVKYDNPDGSDKQGLRLSSAGYQTQWLASEYAIKKLADKSLSPRKRAWNAGLVLGHLAITGAYLTILKDHQDGDALGVAQSSSLSTDQVVSLLLIPAVLDGWRLFGKHTPSWATWASQGFKAVGISASWRF